jgi:CheY-like chemotaxis protein
MTTLAAAQAPSRLLIVDDNPSIHQDIQKILVRGPDTAGLDALESELFGVPPRPPAASPTAFEIDDAYQGEEALRKVEAALAAGRPYAVVFLDVRMPPGWNGLVTMRRLLQVDPELHIVLCTAHSDFSWAEIAQACPHPERLLILKKPFDIAEVAQLAHALAAQWGWARIARDRLDALRSEIDLRRTQIAALGRRQAEDAQAILGTLPAVGDGVRALQDSARGLASLAQCTAETTAALERLGAAVELVGRVRASATSLELDGLPDRLLAVAQRAHEGIERVAALARARAGNA